MENLSNTTKKNVNLFMKSMKLGFKDLLGQVKVTTIQLLSSFLFCLVDIQAMLSYKPQCHLPS